MAKGHTQEGTWNVYSYFSGEDPNEVCELMKLFYRLSKEFVNGQGKLRCLFKEMYDFSQVLTTCLF